MANGHGGVRAGAGRRRKEESKKLQKVLKKSWPLRSQEAAFAKQALAAENGDLDALKFLSSYAYGKPIERHEHEFPELSDAELLTELGASVRSDLGVVAGSEEAKA